jgi:hypothetical protein
LTWQLPSSFRTRQIGTMQVRVNLPSGSSRDNLPAAIAGNIARRMA